MLKILRFLTIIFFIPCSAFQIDRVILSTNNDPLYIQFWPVVARVWKTMGFQPTLALIATEDCQVDTSLGDVIRFEPLSDVSEEAQAIRLLVPYFFSEDVCLLSDIDMIPMSRSYFVDYAHSSPDYAFLVYRDGAWGNAHRYSICYNAAKGKIFSEIFGINSPEDIRKSVV